MKKCIKYSALFFCSLFLACLAEKKEGSTVRFVIKDHRLTSFYCKGGEQKIFKFSERILDVANNSLLLAFRLSNLSNRDSQKSVFFNGHYYDVDKLCRELPRFLLSKSIKSE